MPEKYFEIHVMTKTSGIQSFKTLQTQIIIGLRKFLNAEGGGHKIGSIVIVEKPLIVEELLEERYRPPISLTQYIKTKDLAVYGEDDPDQLVIEYLKKGNKRVVEKGDAVLLKMEDNIMVAYQLVAK